MLLRYVEYDNHYIWFHICGINYTNNITKLYPFKKNTTTQFHYMSRDILRMFIHTRLDIPIVVALIGRCAWAYTAWQLATGCWQSNQSPVEKCCLWCRGQLCSVIPTLTSISYWPPVSQAPHAHHSWRLLHHKKRKYLINFLQNSCDTSFGLQKALIHRLQNPPRCAAALVGYHCSSH